MTPDPVELRSALARLLDAEPTAGTAAVFDVLAAEPRIKPSRGLLIDPGDDAHRRWSCRVAAGAALLSSPAVLGVADELLDELSACPDLAHEVLAAAEPHPAVPPARRELLLALGRRARAPR